MLAPAVLPFFTGLVSPLKCRVQWPDRVVSRRATPDLPHKLTSTNMWLAVPLEWRGVAASASMLELRGANGCIAPSPAALQRHAHNTSQLKHSR